MAVIIDIVANKDKVQKLVDNHIVGYVDGVKARYNDGTESPEMTFVVTTNKQNIDYPSIDIKNKTVKMKVDSYGVKLKKEIPLTETIRGVLQGDIGESGYMESWNGNDYRVDDVSYTDNKTFIDIPYEAQEVFSISEIAPDLTQKEYTFTLEDIYPIIKKEGSPLEPYPQDPENANFFEDKAFNLPKTLKKFFYDNKLKTYLTFKGDKLIFRWVDIDEDYAFINKIYEFPVINYSNSNEKLPEACISWDTMWNKFYNATGPMDSLDSFIYSSFDSSSGFVITEDYETHKAYMLVKLVKNGATKYYLSPRRKTDRYLTIGNKLEAELEQLAHGVNIGDINNYKDNPNKAAEKHRVVARLLKGEEYLTAGKITLGKPIDVILKNYDNSQVIQILHNFLYPVRLNNYTDISLGEQGAGIYLIADMSHPDWKPVYSGIQKSSGFNARKTMVEYIDYNSYIEIDGKYIALGLHILDDSIEIGCIHMNYFSVLVNDYVCYKENENQVGVLNA